MGRLGCMRRWALENAFRCDRGISGPCCESGVDAPERGRDQRMRRGSAASDASVPSRRAISGRSSGYQRAFFSWCAAARVVGEKRDQLVPSVRVVGVATSDGAECIDGRPDPASPSPKRSTRTACGTAATAAWRNARPACAHRCRGQHHPPQRTLPTRHYTSIAASTTQPLPAALPKAPHLEITNSIQKLSQNVNKARWVNVSGPSGRRPSARRGPRAAGKRREGAGPS